MISIYSHVGCDTKSKVSIDGENIRENTDFIELIANIHYPKIIPYNFYTGSAVVLNGEIHIIGGQSYGSGNYYDYHYKWNGSFWTSVSTLPYAVTFRSIVFNDELYIIGGSENSKSLMYKWDGETWLKVSILPYLFSYRGVCILNNAIHIVGGDSNNKRYHYKWDGISWTSVSTLPYDFNSSAILTLDEEIHILGSYNSSDNTKHYKWNGSSWRSVSTLPYQFYSGGSIVINNKIRILGSSFTYQYQSTLINGKKYYEWNGESWTNIGDLPFFISGYASRVVLYKNNIFLVGVRILNFYEHLIGLQVKLLREKR